MALGARGRGWPLYPELARWLVVKGRRRRTLPQRDFRGERRHPVTEPPGRRKVGRHPHDRSDGSVCSFLEQLPPDTPAIEKGAGDNDGPANESTRGGRELLTGRQSLLPDPARQQSDVRPEFHEMALQWRRRAPKTASLETEQDGPFSVCEGCGEQVDPADPNVQRWIPRRLVRRFGASQISEGLGEYSQEDASRAGTIASMKNAPSCARPP